MFFPTFPATDPLLGCRMFYKAEYNSIRQFAKSLSHHVMAILLQYVYFYICG